MLFNINYSGFSARDGLKYKFSDKIETEHAPKNLKIPFLDK